jgi:hypothetical protein
LVLSGAKISEIFLKYGKFPLEKLSSWGAKKSEEFWLNFELMLKYYYGRNSKEQTNSKTQ